MGATTSKPLFFASAALFRTWLQEHHRSEAQLLVGFRRRTRSSPGMSWSEAVDQALCFGWIDGVRRKLDEGSYTVRFTPRQPGSTWSAANVRRIADLQARGLLRAAGKKAFAQRTTKKTGTYSYERPEPAALDAGLERALRADRKAWTFFQAQAPSYRRKIVHWIMSARADDTRQRRLHRAMTSFSQGQRA